MNSCGVLSGDAGRRKQGSIGREAETHALAPHRSPSSSPDSHIQDSHTQGKSPNLQKRPHSENNDASVEPSVKRALAKLQEPFVVSTQTCTLPSKYMSTLSCSEMSDKHVDTESQTIKASICKQCHAVLRNDQALAMHILLSHNKDTNDGISRHGFHEIESSTMHSIPLHIEIPSEKKPGALKCSSCNTMFMTDTDLQHHLIDCKSLPSSYILVEAVEERETAEKEHQTEIEENADIHCNNK